MAYRAGWDDPDARSVALALLHLPLLARAVAPAIFCLQPLAAGTVDIVEEGAC